MASLCDNMSTLVGVDDDDYNDNDNDKDNEAALQFHVYKLSGTG